MAKQQNISSNSIMEKLLASQNQRIIRLSRGQKIEGEIVSITDKEITLDLDTKAEGVLQRKEAQDQSLKVGDKLKAYVYQTENESGQVVLSASQQTRSTTITNGSRGGRGLAWDKFIRAQTLKSRLQGQVLELNKGGLIVEVEGVRGFLPNSQVGFDLLSKSGGGMESLIGQILNLGVVEVDRNNNKLIFTQRGQVTDEVKNKLKEFKSNQRSGGKIVAVLPFGLIVSVKDRSSSGRDEMGVEGLVFISDVSWEKVEDLSKDFKVGQEIEVVISGIDEELGRLNLSIKQLSEDPFAKLAEKYPADEVVKGEIISVSGLGVIVKLEDGIEGLLPAPKMDVNTTYEVSKSITLLVDNVDTARRKINLAPFVTSTAGLIYK